MRRRPGGVRRGKGGMVGGEALGQGGVFGVAGVLEADFEGGEGMAGGGKLMRVCNIYSIGIFDMRCANTTAVRALDKGSCACSTKFGHKYYPDFNKGGRQTYCTRCPTID